jgi:hypothetical protein
VADAEVLALFFLALHFFLELSRQRVYLLLCFARTFISS